MLKFILAKTLSAFSIFNLQEGYNYMLAKRQYGIDLLRIISMLMVLVLHVLLKGGILDRLEPFSAKYYAAWFAEIVCIGAVNCYALISGFVSVERKFKYYKIALLWLQVVFYTVAITLIFAYVLNYEHTAQDIIDSFFPVTSKSYWYFTAYFALFFFCPFLNTMLNALNKRQLKILFATIFIIFSVIPTIKKIDLFNMANGYSFIWLMMLYLIGGITKKLQSHNFKRKNFVFLILLFFVSVIIGLAFKLYSAKNPDSAITQSYVIGYAFIPNFISAYCLFLISVNMDIKSKPIVSIIKFLSPLSFSVYLIHTNPWIWNEIMNKKFEHYTNLHAFRFVIAVALTVLAIYFICSSIDLIRYYLFKLLKLPQRLARLEENITNKLHKNEVKIPEEV